MPRPSPNHGTQRLPNDDDERIMCNYIVKKLVRFAIRYICIYQYLAKILKDKYSSRSDSIMYSGT